MSPGEFLESKDRFLYQAFNALSRWRRRKRNHSTGSKGKSFYFRPSLDGLEQRFLPASLLTGTQMVLGINDGGSFVTPNDKGTLVGLQFAGSDLLSPGTPLGGFSVSANNQSYFNYYYQSSLTGTLTDVSTPGTQALRFVSKTIPGLTITRQISMPTDSRQILVSMTFENTTNLGSQPKTFTNLASMEIDDPDPNGFITVNDVLGLDNNSVLGRGNSTSGLTFGLFSASTTAYASIVGTESGFGFTDSDPLLFLPSPRGTLPSGVNDPNGKSQDLPIRLADSIPSLAPGKSATLYSTIIVGSSTSQVDADATTLARNTSPTGIFDALTGPKNSAVSSASITFGLPVVGLKASDFSLTFKGTPVPLSGLTLVPLDGGNGTHFRLDGLSSFTRSEGDYQLSLNTGSGARDMAGRALATPAVLSWKLDNTPPNAPIFTGFSPNTGGRPTDPLTNASQIILSGEAEVGAKVEIASPSSDGGFGTILASPVADSTGKWQATISTSLLKEGTVPLVARATDTSGNVSSQYGGFSFRLDLTAPALPGIPNITQDTGFSSTDKITRETTPSLSGNAEANSQILIQLVGQGTIGTSQADKDGKWTFNWPSSLAKLSDGTHQFQISAIDAAGNQSAIRTLSVLVDTNAPSASTLDSTIVGLVPSGDLLLSNGQSVILTGKGEAGASVSLAFDKSVLGTAIIGSDGRWSVPVNLSVFADGKYNLLLNTSDSAGNTNAGFGPAIVIDTGPPVPPVIQSAVGTAGKIISNGQSSNAPVVVLTGISEPNSLVEVTKVGGSVVGTIRAGADGKWTLTTNSGKSFTDGSYSFAARALDDVGNSSSFGANFVIQVDTVAPSAPVIQGISPDTGLPGDGITKLPRLDVFGTAEPGSTVRLDLAGFGTLGNATADTSGNWRFSVNDGILKDGVRQLMAQATDPAGNTGVFSDNFQATIDTVAPDQPTVVEVSGDTNNDRITNDNFPTLRGLAEPFALVEVSISGLGILGQVQADDTGSWILPWGASSPLENGVYQVTATATDSAGNRGNQSNPFSIQIDTAAPNAPVILGIAPDTGLPGDAVTAISHLDIFGDAEPSSTVQIELAGFGVLGTTTTDASGRWHFEVVAGILTDGAQQFVATATDISGNRGSPSESFQVILDTVAPVNTRIVGLSGDPNSDRISTDNTPDFRGTAEPLSMVEVSISGLGIMGQVQADSSGNWFLPWTPGTSLSDGTYQVSATATDSAGNQSDVSPEFQVVIDTTAPLAPVISRIDPDTGKDSNDQLTSSVFPVFSGFAEPGSILTLTQNESGFFVQALVAPDGSWHADFSSAGPLGDGTWTFSAVATDVAGNTSTPSDPFAIKVDTLTPVIPSFSGLLNDTGIDSDDLVTNSLAPGLKGLAEPGSTVIISNNDLEIGRVKVGADGRWAFDMASHPLTQGIMHFRLRSEDDAGNLSDWSAPLSVTIDTTSPDSASELAIDPITGDLAGLPLVNQGTVSLSGLAESDSTIQVTLDGTDLGSLVTGTGNWSILLGNSLSEGTHNAQVRVTDRAGNSSVWSTYFFGVDVTPPAIPVINGIAPDTGSISNDALTRSDQVSLSGTAEPGASLEISLDGLVVGNIVSDTTGNWSYDLPVKLGNGIHQVGVIATDHAGNQSVEAGQFSFTVDTIAPVAPLIGSISPDSGIDGDGLVNSRDLSVLGVAEPFSSVDVFAGSNLLGTVQVNDKGQWTLKIPDANQAFLTEGKNQLRARATDQAGNTSAASTDFALTLDTQKPGKPSLTSIQADTGIPGDLLTSDRRPLILGKAEPFSIVQVFLADKLLGATTADSLGNWKFQPVSDLPLGSNPIRLRAIDVAGNFGDLADPVAINVNIDVPPVPLILGFGPNTGNPSDWVTSANQVTLQGTAKPNTFIDILVRGNFAGRVQTDDKGVWSFAIPTYLAEGSYDIQARSISLSGVESPLSGVATIKVDNTAPVVPVIDAVAPDTGSSSSDFITKSGTLVLKGHGEAGATVEVRLDALVAGSVIIGPDGNWEVALGDNLANRIYKITVRSTDPAGNQSDWSKDSTLLVDKVAPDAPVIGRIDPDTGKDNSDRVTFSQTPVFSGSAEPGTTLTLLQNELGWMVQVQVANDGTWRADFGSKGLLTDGTWTFSAVATDIAGNTSALSQSFSIRVDTVSPVIPTFSGLLNDTGRESTDLVTNSRNPGYSGVAEPGSTVFINLDDVQAGSATAGTDGRWIFNPSAQSLSEGTHRLRLRSLDQAGNLSDWSSPFQFTVDTANPGSVTGLAINPITGKNGTLPLSNQRAVFLTGLAEADSTIEAQIDGLAAGSLVTDNGNWSITLGNALTEGLHTAKVRVIDRAGNISGWTSYSFGVDVTPPASPVISGIAPDTGSSLTDLLTQSNQLSISGTAEANSTLTISLDGAVAGTVLTDSKGGWSFSIPSKLGDGGHRIQVTATDQAGNASTAPGELSFTVDTAAPLSPSIQSVSPDTGTDGDNLVNTRALSILGKAEPSAKVDLFAGTNLLGSVLANAQGDWVLKISDASQAFLTEGKNLLRARATDQAGNTSAASSDFALTLDTQKPGKPSLTSIQADTGIPGDLLTSDRRPLILGKAEPFSIVQVFLADKLLGATTADSLGNWKFQPVSDLPLGSNPIRLRAIDVAGNFGDLADPVAINVNIDVPPVPLILGFAPNTGNPADWVTSANQITLQGTAKPNTFIDILVRGNFAGRVQTDDKGVWSFAIPTYLAEGSYDIQARSISLSGVESPLSGVATIKVDNTAPVVPVIDAVAPDTGSSSSDFITKSGTLVLKGHGEAGAMVEVRLDALVAGSVIIGPDGNWEVALGDNLANRIYKITVRSTDPAGNQSDWSKDSTLLIDKVAPDVEISQPVNGGIFNDATWPGTIKGSVSHPPGESEIKAVWITLQDTESGTWFDGNSFTSSTPVPLSATLLPGTNRVNWSLDLPSSKLRDAKNYQANIVAEDVAGNQTEPEAQLHFSLDRVPPKVVITPSTTPLSVNFAPLVLDLQFSESILGLDSTDFALPNGGKVLSVSGSDSHWTVTIQPGVMGGQFKAYFIGQGIQDLAGNQAADVSFQYRTDVGDTLDNAYLLTLNSGGSFNFTGSFETTNRSDWFKLPMPAASQGLEMTLGGVTSPILAGWYDASGNLLSSAIATPDSDGTLRIQPTAQARFLRIEHGNFNGTTTGFFDAVPTTYSLRLSTIDPILDPQGNSQETAQALALSNNRLSASGDKISFLDSEYMRFTAPSTGFFDAVASPSVDSPLNATLVAFDSQGRVLAIQAPGQGKDSGKIRIPIIAGREYYLRVESLADANGLGGTGKWSLSGQFILSPEAGSATKGTGAITTLDSAGRATINGALDFPGAAELATLPVEASGNYLVRLNPKVTSPDLTPRIIVLDQNFQMVQQSIGVAGTALTANLRLQTKGTYFLLFAAEGGTTGSFDGIIQTDDLGTTPATAGRFSTDQGTQKASGSIDLSGDQDLFQFVAPVTGVYQVVLKSEDGSMGQFGFASSAGSIPTGPATSSVGKVNVEAGQTLFLRIEGIDSAVGKYKLELKTTADDFTDLLDPTKATSIQTGRTLPGKLEAFGDKDIFAWTAPSDPSALPPFGAFFASALSDPSQPVDTYLSVYRVDADGSVVPVDSNNDSFLGSDAVVFFQASAGTTYLFEVRGAHDLDAGTYKFALKEDRLEVGDSNPGSFQLARLDKQYQLDQATDLKLNGAIQSETHQDIVRFVPNQSGTWIIKADAGPGSRLDPYITLFDSSYGKIASDDNSGPGSGSLILTNLVEGNEYFISVSSTSGTGAYSLSAQLFKNPVQTNTDDFPADKVTLVAPSIQSATKQSGNIDFAGDTDTFTFQWPDSVGSATLTARLDPGSKSSVDPYLTILDTSGNILYSSDNTGSSLSSTVVFDVDPGQKLLIRASGANKSLGSYNLSIEPIAQPVSDDFPGSPTAANMPSIEMADTTSLVTTSVPVFTGKTTGKIDQLGDRDFVKVVAPTDGMLTATYSRDKETFLNPYLRAFGSDPTGGLIQLTSDDDSQGGLDSKLQVRVKAGQEIFLLATGAAGTTGSYSIDVGIRQDDIGGLPATAQPLRLDGLKAQATGTIETGADTDMFIYQPTRSGSVTARLTGMSGDLNPYLFVYQARDGALVTSNNDISPTIKDSQIQMQVEAGETYFFSVRSAANTMGDYLLDIAPVVDDYPSSLKSARILPLETGNQGSISGKIEAIGDSDWFRVIPSQDGILKVRVDGVGPTMVDPTLAVYNDAGQVISTSDDTIVDGVKSTGSEVSLVGRAGRSYFIRAMGYGESTGSYEVKVETGSALSDDFGNTIDTADLLELDSSNQATFEGSLGAADQDVVRFIAPLTGDFVVTYNGQAGQLRALTRDNGETLQVASGDLNGKQGTFRFHVTQGQEVFLYATSPEDSKILGGSFKSEIKLIEGASTANAVSGDVVNSLNNTLTQTFTQLIGQGETTQDFYKIRDQITKALIENLKAASGGSLTTSYLVIWLDPVDFVVTDSASQQIGNRASQGSINENASASLSQKGALDLVIIPGASASNYNMQLFGVGGGRVLAGATMVQSDGTVVNPRVTVNGSSNESGIPVGSVPKEGLSLSLDFRGEQPTEVPSMQPAVASLGNAAQQIVGSLVNGVSTGTGAVGDLALASAEFEVTNLLTLLVGADSDLAQVSLDETGSLSPFAWNTKEGKELVSLVRNFALDISDSVSKGLRLIARDAQIPAEDLLTLVKTSLDRLGLDSANTVVSRIGSEARNMLTRLIDRDLKVELVNKPMKQFWSGLLKELESGKIGKALPPAASKAIRDAVLSNANLEKQTEPERQAEKLSKAQTISGSNGTAGAETNLGQTAQSLGIAPGGNEDSLDPVESNEDDLWLNGFNQSNQSSPTFKNDPARDESTDALFGMVAAALLVPTWISSGPGDRKKRPGSPLGIGQSGSEKESDRTA